MGPPLPTPHTPAGQDLTPEQAHQGSAPPPRHSSIPSAVPFPKDCKACDGVVNMFTSFHRMAKVASPTELAGTASLEHPAAGLVSSPQLNSNHKSHSSLPTTSQGEAAVPEAAAQVLPCPPGTKELGRSTWTFLHTMAAYYPEEPSGPQRSLMRSMMEGLAEFYPCHYCAAHLQQQIQESPPEVTSGSQLSQWLCRIHNEVNEMLGKPVFDCARAMERWREGPADGSC